jgi:hypothetical protein
MAKSAAEMQAMFESESGVFNNNSSIVGSAARPFATKGDNQAA